MAAYRDGEYALAFLNQEYRVRPDEGKITGPEGDPLPADPEFELLLLSYLIHAQDTSLAGDWISEKDLPGGSTFFRGTHCLPLEPLVRRFGGNPDAFRKACAALGGEPINYGDAAFRFTALPRLPMAGILWSADEEFPARAGVLFDRSLAHQLPLDVVLALVHCVVRALLETDSRLKG